MPLKRFEAKKTLAKGWEITQKNKRKLFWYGFLPSFFSIGVGAIVVYIQFILFKNSSFFTSNPQTIIDVIKPIYYWIMSPEMPSKAIITSLFFIFLASYILPSFCQGAIIAMTKTRNQDDIMDRGLGKGLNHFLPIFEFSILEHSLKPYSVVVEMIFFARFLGASSVPFLKVLFFIIAPVGAIFLFFFSFVPQSIVIERKHMGDAIFTSMKMVSIFFIETLKVILLLLFIEIRVVFNVLLIFLLPIIILAMGGLWAETIIGYIAEAVVFLLLLSLAASVSGIVFVYGKITWTLVYIEFQNILQQE